jgi:hypothetical protein
MLPPILEIYVVWHPLDASGMVAATQIMDHFHGTTYSGLIGGAVEVFVRSDPWRGAGDAPRPLPFMTPPPYGVAPPGMVAVVPVIDTELAAEAEDQSGPWFEYLASIRRAHDQSPLAVRVFPLCPNASALDGTAIEDLFGSIQRLGASHSDEVEADIRCRDLAQGIAQWVRAGRLTVFLSHTMHRSAIGNGEEVDVDGLLDQIRGAIHDTRLAAFFDAADLQPGEDWEPHLQEMAERSALLAVRTDLYASREWCQREVRIAKQAGMPVVILDALGRGEDRGSFLMDHVPRIPVLSSGSESSLRQIRRALNQLVDECLKRALWQRQEAAASGDAELNIAWWAPHAPEPVTFAPWIRKRFEDGELALGAVIRVLHPDPPLGQDEVGVLQDISSATGLAAPLEVLTPRTLAARGG